MKGFLRSRFVKRFLRHRLAVVGSSIILLLIFTALLGGRLAPYDPVALDFEARLTGPSSAHWLGTDEFGRDVFSRILHGASVSLQVALIAVSISTFVGVLLGALAAFYGGWLEEIVMRFMDVLFAFPAVLLAITVMAILGRGVENAMIAIAIVYVPIFARVTRGAVIGVRNAEFVNAARALGRRESTVLFRHVLPNALGPIIAQVSISLAFAILAEAALSFFGLGTQPPDPSWGRMLASGRSFLHQAWWLGVFPGLAIMLSVMGFNFLGDALRDLLDPRMRSATK